MELIKRRSGFTLIEVMLSIAVLAIISVFVLEMFIVSSNANKKAQNIDIAASKAMSEIEMYKSGGYIPKTTAFDETWNIVDVSDDDAVFIMNAEIKDIEGIEVRNIISFSSESNSDIENDIYAEFSEPGRMAEISVYVISLAADEKYIIAGYTAKKYIKGGDSK